MATLPVTSKVIKALVFSTGLKVAHEMFVFVFVEAMEEKMQIMASQIQFKLNLMKAPVTLFDLADFALPREAIDLVERIPLNPAIHLIGISLKDGRYRLHVCDSIFLGHLFHAAARNQREWV